VNSWDMVTARLAPRANETTPSDGVEDGGREVVTANGKQKESPVAPISSVVPNSTPLVFEQPQVQPEWKSAPIEHLQSEFMRVCLPLFFAEQDAIRSLGLTSALAGEGKTSVAWLVSHALATSFGQSVVLVECDWDRPTFSRGLGLPASPGLAEYLTGSCQRAEVRYQFLPNLTVIPAGLGGPAALAALAPLQREEFYGRLADPGELLILDLPSVLGSSYGTLAVRLAEALMLVVRAGATPAPLVSRASEELKAWRVEGLILNQVQTQIPHWLQRLL
jgi:Mrp family chromosome partitioning ATPase